ncbi:ABC transporter substrate-binding protein [Halopiger xanaduensis]|uniref:ABC-type transporter, periplasmic subunit n=1 Tax=Halopiger xanaduensis (strain DSM 18323 / JCM 14033 / SH-6) TaxID=797210 RepID=F8D982_HALXS|nr:ABC transporter substrate-binding protein [Halopiger xanaduensis]AEH35694.1 ABC-type transporter, periplasmic subunit [Halopiger xanaduensis SH-6]
MQGARHNELDRRRFLQLTGIATTAGLTSIAGCIDDSGGSSNDEFVVTQGEFATTVDPNGHNDAPTYNVLDQVYEPLWDITPDGELEPRIVEEWTHPDDSTMELTVRDDVVFHEGQEMTASDVAYTINRAVDEEVGIASEQADRYPGVVGAEAPDDTTVLIEHESVPSIVEFNVATVATVVSQEWMEEREQPVTDELNGTGPYQVDEYTPDEEITFTTFDDYWGETPDLDPVRFRGASEASTRVSELETGESDLVVNVPPSDVANIDEAEDVEVRTVTSLRNIFLVMPNDDEPFDSQEFRQAMNYAVDVDAIIENVLDGFGSPTSQPIPEGIFGYNDDLDPYPHDLEQAEQLVEDSGYSGVEITLESPEGRYLNDTEVAETAAQQIDQLENVSCDFQITDFETITESSLDADPSTSPDFFLIGWGNPTYDADYGLAPWFVSGQAAYNFEDEEIEEKILESQQTSDPDEREQLLQEINADLHEAAPWVFLHREESIYGIRSDVDWDPRADESILLDEMST